MSKNRNAPTKEQLRKRLARAYRDAQRAANKILGLDEEGDPYAKVVIRDYRLQEPFRFTPLPKHSALNEKPTGDAQKTKVEMNFLKTDHGWVSDDALKLCFHSEQPPDNVEAHRIGHGSCYNGYPGVRVFLKEAIMQGAVEFGPPRSSSLTTDTNWTGDSYRFGLCSLPDRHRMLIIEINGSGNFFYLWDQQDALVMWTTLLRQIPEPRLWDLLHGLTGTWQNGTHTERNRLYAMAAAGKLQRRKIRGQDAYRCVESR